MDTIKIQKILAEFARERDWDQFHTPKNLSTALMCEAGELAEIFQWMSSEESLNAMNNSIIAQAIKEEIADVQLYLLRIADRLGVDIESALMEKIEINSSKYPVSLSKGNSEKYSRRKLES